MNLKVFTAKVAEFFAKVAKDFSLISNGTLTGSRNISRRFPLINWKIFLADLADLRSFAFLCENLCALCEKHIRLRCSPEKNLSQISQIYADAYSSALLRENLCAPLREKYSAHQSREKNFSQISQIYADTFTISPMCSMWFNFH
jgi:hypothetical protein